MNHSEVHPTSPPYIKLSATSVEGLNSKQLLNEDYYLALSMSLFNLTYGLLLYI